MSLLRRHAQVRAAQQRMRMARAAVAAPASALLARGEQHPVATLGIATGAGFVMGHMDVHPLRIPGLGGLIGGVMAEATALGASFIAQSAEPDA